MTKAPLLVLVSLLSFACAPEFWLEINPEEPEIDQEPERVGDVEVGERIKASLSDVADIGTRQGTFVENVENISLFSEGTLIELGVFDDERALSDASTLSIVTSVDYNIGEQEPAISILNLAGCENFKLEPASVTLDSLSEGV